MTTLEIISVILLGLGGLVMLIGAAGVVRFPDFYARLHAAGKGDTLGQALVLLGLGLPVLQDGFGLILLKLLLIILFVFIFNPTATHALARGAWVSGLEPWKRGDPVQEPEDEDGDQEGGA